MLIINTQVHGCLLWECLDLAKALIVSRFVFLVG